MHAGDGDDGSAPAEGEMAGERSDRNATQRAIMEATYEALVTHGYADLTIQNIADAFPKSKSLLYYHYDAKADIILDFLEYLLDEFEAQLDASASTGDPRAALNAVLDVLVPRTLTDEERALRVALVELQPQAAHDDRFRARYAALIDGARDAIRRALAAGVESGTFRPVDPDREATHLFATLIGAILEQTTVDPDAGMRVRDAVDAYVERVLVA